jgi:NAD(P)-dependent dehydrogenase (short-subunit alcohol dehydrogenase family)
MRKPDPSIRIAVTGAGVVCSIGRNKDEVWRSIIEARAGIGALTRFPGETFPTDIAAEVAGELPKIKRLSRTDILAVVAAKEAIRGLTRTAATEWGRFGITVNCVCPVSVRHHTPGLDDPERLAKFERGFSRQPVPRDGRLEEDIAPVVGFLLSDASAFVTGQTLMADGGRIMLR